MPEKKQAEALSLSLADSEVVDIAVEELRKRQAWEVTDKVLDVVGQKNSGIPVVRRAILRFALSSPTLLAADFVQKQRRDDPGTVGDVEESLKAEREAGK